MMQIESITLWIVHLQAQRKFYSNSLGFAVVAETENATTFKIGKSLLIFQKEQDFNSFYRFAFDIPCNQVEEAATWLSQRVLLLENEGQSCFRMVERWNSSNMYFADPEGNIAEFIARHQQHHLAQSIFKSESISHKLHLNIRL